MTGVKKLYPAEGYSVWSIPEVSLTYDLLGNGFLMMLIRRLSRCTAYIMRPLFSLYVGEIQTVVEIYRKLFLSQVESIGRNSSYISWLPNFLGFMQSPALYSVNSKMESLPISIEMEL